MEKMNTKKISCKEWFRIKNDVICLQNSLLKKINKMDSFDSKKRMEEFKDKRNKILKLIPDHSKYIAFHAMYASSTDRETSPYGDFPGDKSIIRFLKFFLK